MLRRSRVSPGINDDTMPAAVLGVVDVVGTVQRMR